ncbi:MAG TPA: alpha-1,4-glucan--maltose-1-phosphate maltosyltransferase [Solirubrobacteraceae bacterium]|jgi:starch synthase (maltosyl-transferring)|nr:alpha-1,4-glucan--maltose-1-phosphate maltosyltransferase [Solirubrobacteraceae bacterium]
MEQAIPVRRSTNRGGAAPQEAPPRARRRPSRILIEDLYPVVDCGRFRVKRCVGDRPVVAATIVRDGHDVMRAAVQWRLDGQSRWHEAPMQRVDAEVDGDRWSGAMEPLDAVARWQWRIVAWADRFASWREELARKLAAGQEGLDSELAEGAMLLERMCARASREDRDLLRSALRAVADESAPEQNRHEAALEPAVLDVAGRWQAREDLTASTTMEIEVERERARFGSWYELFPRSWGGFDGVRRVLGSIAEAGFDVLYLPPIHPIGVTNRKGRNDSPRAEPGDPGSPYAIGGAEGGHTAIHPELGTIEEFDALVAEARAAGMEIALDYALQCSADHPWLSEHPEWFSQRPDGTLKYAENPPKRYVDIYNFDFECEEWRALWEALRDVMLFWVEHGVRAFRVDNPHTKPLAFWEWLIASVRAVEPETIFLSEAFTRQAMMAALAKSGFSQSYTYFTWKNSTWELRDYVSELARPPLSDFLRPNFFVNTPDILSEYLQVGGPGAFAVRLLLAGTLSPSYGIYSGFERYEATPRHPGSEEYLDSEKYQVRKRSFDGPLLASVARLNRVRRERPALQRLDNIAFLPTENDALLAYAKREGRETLVVVANVDPERAQEGVVVVPGELGLAPVFSCTDLLDGSRYEWRLGRNYVRLDPAERPGHLLAVEAS